MKDFLATVMRPQASDPNIFWATDKIHGHIFILDTGALCSMLPVTAERAHS